jgi:hypothetical protein
MSDRLESSLRETGDVVGELVAKAGEANRAGTSRRRFFEATASLAGATALGAAGLKLIQPLSAAAAVARTTTTTDTFMNIIHIAATAEALASTFYYLALKSSQLPDVNSAANRNYFQAAVVQEYTHLEIMRSLGGGPLYKEFYFPDGMFTDETVFFPTASLLEDYFISAYIAAAMEFSGVVSSGITTPNPVAIGLAVQIAGIECEHRALLNVAANINPANNVLIETALLTSVSGAVAPLTPFLTGGMGYSGPYPLPSMNAINTVAQPYGFSSFPSYTIV